MNVEEARRITKEAKSLEGEFLRMETDKILIDIAHAAGKGRNSTSCNQTHEVIKNRLITLGYSVTYHSDQREGDYLVITW